MTQCGTLCGPWTNRTLLAKALELNSHHLSEPARKQQAEIISEFLHEPQLFPGPYYQLCVLYPSLLDPKR